MQSATITEEITSLARRRNRDWVLASQVAVYGARIATGFAAGSIWVTELSRAGQATGARACFSSPWPAPRPTPFCRWP
jgi:hypothetical protein